MGMTTDTLTVTGETRLLGDILPGPTRAQLRQENLAPFVIPLTAWRVWDGAMGVLPGTPAGDDLGLVGGTFGTASPTLQTKDEKANATPTASYARTVERIPIEYVAAQTVTLRIHAGMITSIADQSATVDAVVYEADKESGISADLCTTAAQDCNSLTMADFDFTITPAALVAGDILDIRIALTLDDDATGTVVSGIIGYVALLCDVKG